MSSSASTSHSAAAAGGASSSYYGARSRGGYAGGGGGASGSYYGGQQATQQQQQQQQTHRPQPPSGPVPAAAAAVPTSHAPGGYSSYGGYGAAPPDPGATAAPAQEDWFSGTPAAAPAASSSTAHQPSAYGTPAPPPAPQVSGGGNPSDPFGYGGGKNGGAGAGAAGGGYSGTIMQPTPGLSGPMGGAMSKGGGGASSASVAHDDYENEPPLMEELGINMDHIATKSRAVVLPFGKYASTHLDKSMMEDADLAGPLVFGLALGGELLMAGKVSFGYIYGFGMFGCLALSLVLNLMSPTDAISVWTVISVMGYALLPVNALAGINAILRISHLGVVGVVLSALTIVWCTTASTRLFENGCGLRDQRYLVAYPVILFYSAFVIITIF